MGLPQALPWTVANATKIPAMRTTWRTWCALLGLLAACRAPVQRVGPQGPRITDTPAAPVARPFAPAEPVRPEAGAQNPLYSFDEAMADALSGPLTFIGVGGDGGHLSCAYRNERVIVLDEYCTQKEMSAFGVAVLSPARGRVKLYAEARAPISTLKKADYLTFYGESEPASATLTPALSLSMPYEAITAYDRARARRYLPSCVNGMEGGRHKEACHKHLRPHAAAFAARSQPFLQEPPEVWYQLVRRLADERKQERVIVTPGSFRAVGESYAWARRIALSS